MSEKKRIVEKERKTLIEEVISIIAEENLTELKPKIESMRTIKYPDVEESLRIRTLEYMSEIEEALEKITRLKIAEKYVEKRIVSCPFCKSINIAALFQCPICGSNDVTLVTVIQHKCGRTGLSVEFEKNGKLICPFCNSELKKEGEDYNIIGETFYCNKCMGKFSQPVIVFECLDCGATFGVREAYNRAIYRYVVKLSQLAEYRIRRALGTLIKILKEKKFMVNVGGEIEGFSGIKHKFDIVAIKDNTKIAVDFIKAVADELELSRIITTEYGKAIDVRDVEIILVIPYEFKTFLPAALPHAGVNIYAIFMRNPEDFISEFTILVEEIMKKKKK